MEEVVIDLEEVKKNKDRLDESFLTMFGGAVKMILKRMFGGSNIPVKVRGNKRDVRKFAKTIKGEKEYMEALERYGLNDPKTFRSKHKLNKSIEQFERSTGLKWPFS